MRLRLLEDLFGIIKLTPPQAFPAWLTEAPIFFVARTEDEYSIMCPQYLIPEEVLANTGYQCLRVEGDMTLEAVGVVAGVSKPLADAGLSLFLISTHDRDYVLVHQRDLTKAIDIYQKAGFTVIFDSEPL
jgi:hypothetical protein